MTNRRLLSSILPLLVLLTPASARSQVRPGVKPGWEWSDDSVFKVTNAVRAGRSLKPKSWPGGTRVAVLFSFDVDNETVSLRFGEPTIGALSQGEYGARVGLPRIVRLFDKYRIPVSYFIPAMSAKIHPEEVDLIRKSGRNEIGIHGYIHELNSQLPYETEKDLLERAMSYWTKTLGSRPVGYRAPSWNFSPNTLRILREMGFMYESSMMSDESPYELLENGQPTGIVELPVEWIMDDAPLFSPQGNAYESPRDIAKVWMDEFDLAWQEGAGTMFLLTMHPHISGHRSRVVALELLIQHIKAKGGVWFATHREAAEYVKKEAGMK
ncbi:MAG: polysaccharide deacetylase [Gemmatimonadaceae bacterium]